MWAHAIEIGSNPLPYPLRPRGERVGTNSLASCGVCLRSPSGGIGAGPRTLGLVESSTWYLRRVETQPRASGLRERRSVAANRFELRRHAQWLVLRGSPATSSQQSCPASRQPPRQAPAKRSNRDRSRSPIASVPAPSSPEILNALDRLGNRFPESNSCRSRNKRIHFRNCCRSPTQLRRLQRLHRLLPMHPRFSVHCNTPAICPSGPANRSRSPAVGILLNAGGLGKSPQESSSDQPSGLSGCPDIWQQPRFRGA